MVIEKLIMFASGGFFGGDTFGEMLNSWEQAGVFTYLLPFLLMFAIINAILTKTKVFDNKTINSIIAFVVALMALQFGFVSQFFSELFPRLGVGLVIVLVVIILLGLFAPNNKSWMGYIFLGLGAIILIVVLVQTSGALGWEAGYWFSDNWKDIVWVVIFLILMGIAAGAPNPDDKPIKSIISKALGGE